MMSAFAPSSFAGLTSSLLVWLLCGGSLSLHHPFDDEILEIQIHQDGCDTLVAPASLALRLSDLDGPSRMPTLRTVIGLWRAPEQITSSPLWTTRRSLTSRLSTSASRVNMQSSRSSSARRMTMGSPPALMERQLPVSVVTAR